MTVVSPSLAFVPQRQGTLRWPGLPARGRTDQRGREMLPGSGTGKIRAEPVVPGPPKATEVCAPPVPQRPLPGPCAAIPIPQERGTVNAMRHVEAPAGRVRCSSRRARRTRAHRADGSRHSRGHCRGHSRCPRALDHRQRRPLGQGRPDDLGLARRPAADTGCCAAAAARRRGPGPSAPRAAAADQHSATKPCLSGPLADSRRLPRPGARRPWAGRAGRARAGARRHRACGTAARSAHYRH